MSINYDRAVPIGVTRVLELAAQLGVLTLLDEDESVRRDLANQIEDQADLMTRQELRVLRHAAVLALEVAE
jgi:hypothetical protein